MLTIKWPAFELWRFFSRFLTSTIDFSMDIDKQENPAGDRVVITLNGKFLK